MSEVGSSTVQRTTGRALARWSWLCFLIFFGLNFVGRATGLRVSAELLGLMALLAGLGLGIAALCLVQSQGRSGILAPALVGVVLNATFVAIWITNFLSTLARVGAGRSMTTPG